MNEFTLSGAEWFDGVPDPVLWLRDGVVAYRNPAAADVAAQGGVSLPVDAPQPLELAGLTAEEISDVRWCGRSWTCRSAALSDGVLLQLTPVAQDSLTPERLSQLAARLRPHLGRLIGSIQQLERAPADWPEAKRRQWRAIQSKSYHCLLHMLDSMEFFGSHAGVEARPFSGCPLDFGGLCAEVVRGVEALAEQAGRTVRLEPWTGNLLIQGEEPLLRRMLYQLISNGLRAAGDGGSVTLRLEKRGRSALLTVQDSGSGFSPRELSAAFDASFAWDDLTGSAGLGLGIPICRLAAQRHGGRLALLSGRGGRVTVELPLCESVTGGTLHSRTDFTGGFNEVLTALADVLPWQCFLPED